MKTAFTLSSGVGLVAVLASSALAQEPASSTEAAAAPKMSASAQFEMLPIGTTKASFEGESFSDDNAVAYGVSAAFDYAVTPFLKLGAAPRLILNVISDDADDDAESATAFDLRLRALAHFPIAPKLEAYASLSPGYTIVMPSQDGADNATGFAIAAAAGVTYDVSPAMFVSGEVGYQRAFTSVEDSGGGQTVEMDVDFSYLHVGLGAGTRF